MYPPSPTYPTLAAVRYDLKGRHAGESGWAAYARSKMYTIAWSMELDRRLKGSGVDVFAVHPGGLLAGARARWPPRPT